MNYQQGYQATVPNDDFKFISPEPPPKPRVPWWRKWLIAFGLVLLGALIGSLTSLIVVNEALAFKRIQLPSIQWAIQYGLVEGVVVSGAPSRRLHATGQVGINSAGVLVAKDDMRAQMITALQNVDRVLANAKLTRADIVKVRVFTTDLKRVVDNYGVYSEFVSGGDTPAITLVGVQDLGPDILVEIEVEAEK
eukprot:CAMPEP_0116841408 /NCGR_PEP_ID=MMETSP0418-20121206/10908_1 /TAXON_ID=1158023 /ORGANISM="Astrosyne radiata, Strain 13vi08-1A" /LENGTH=192 /DNA_ID=CAMNT_0004471831 /DNA_START=50 /DNA_END=628 /DNA_ORIENTATION=+